MTQHPAVRNGAYDVHRVREDFPALAMKVYGKPLVYLDNAASAQKPTAVLDRMTEAYKSEYANVHRGLHYLANAATEAYEGARAKVAKFINAARNEEIIFTRNVTEAINLVASSWGEPNIKPGDEIVLSIMEHHSNIVPWHFLRERHGATTGALDESLLFYLRARGLPEKEAQALLIQAFVGEAIESIVNDDLRELAITTAQRWLEARS